MPAEESDAAKITGVVQQLVTLLGTLPAELRARAIRSAQIILGDEIALTGLQSDSKNTTARPEAHDNSDLGEFFARQPDSKPSDNVYTAAAYHFSTYGAVAFTLDDLRGIAQDAGAVLPDRLDMTLKQAARGGKKLFQTLGRDAYKPTAAAALHFKEKFAVAAGRAPKSS